MRTNTNRLTTFLGASLVAMFLVAIPLGWGTGIPGSALALDTCDAGSCRPNVDWVCNLGNQDHLDKCDVDDCGN